MTNLFGPFCLNEDKLNVIAYADIEYLLTVDHRHKSSVHSVCHVGMSGHLIATNI